MRFRPVKRPHLSSFLARFASIQNLGIASPPRPDENPRVTTALIALAAALLAALFTHLWARSQLSGLTERLRSQTDEAQRLTAALATAQLDLRTTESRAASLDSALSAERAAAAEKIRTLVEAHERLTSEFKALSADALARNNTAFLELAQATLAKFQLKAETDLTARQQAIDHLVRPLKESLEKVDLKIVELEKTRANAYGTLTEQLKNLGAAQLQLQTEASKLSTALRSTSFAGSWGELQLRRVVELADMLPYCDFTEQQTSGASGDKLRADLIVRLPGGQQIVIDAKTPIQSYRDSLDSNDEASRQTHLATHAAKVRSHIDALSGKSYWEQYQPSPEFVVLFLPGDHFLTAALQADPTLLDRAINRKVLLATPTTLIALLKAASYGWRHETVSQNAAEVSALGRALYDRLSTFSDHLEKIGRALESANKSYNSALGSYESQILPGARRFAELGAKGTKELTEPAVTETALRELNKRA